MSWGHRRRTGPKKPAVEAMLRGSVINQVRRLLDNRHRLLAPFTLAPMDLYRLLWTDREWAALETLRHEPELFNKGRWMSISGVPIDGSNRWNVTVQLPEVIIGGSTAANISFIDLPEDMQSNIKEWAPAWRKMHMEKESICGKIEQVSEVCKTPGHAARIWPDLIGFFDEGARRTIDNAKVRSSYPDGAMYWEDYKRKRVRPEFSPQAFEPFTVVLAEALMLPFTEGEHVAVVYAHL